METNRLMVRAALVAALTLVADQVLKLVVSGSLSRCVPEVVTSTTACDQQQLVGSLRLLLVQNAGSVGGAAQGLWVWVVVAIAGLLLLPVYGRQLRQGGWLAVLGLGLQAGGALGNVVDRLLRGGVIDYLAVGGVVINLADVALVVGMVLAVSALLRSGIARQPTVVHRSS